MKILYYDCFSGISGDMNLAALIDLGVPEEYLKEELKKLNVDGYSIDVYKDERKGITGTKVDVNLHHHAHNHDHHHHGEHTHGHEHNHSHGHEGGEHHHRTYKDIEKMINESELSDSVKENSIKMFKLLAKAEGKVHGKSYEEVHFHEVGALDSIVDTIGAAICLDYLNIDEIWSSSVELGGGFVKCAHGMMPVPAPATVEVLKGVPVTSGAVNKETTTPTGATILASNVSRFTDNKNFIIDDVAYGIGTRDTEIPNVLRVMLATVGEKEVVKKKI